MYACVFACVCIRLLDCAFVRPRACGVAGHVCACLVVCVIVCVIIMLFACSRVCSVV